MFGMAKKPRTRAERVVSVCALVVVLAWGTMDAFRSHGGVRFLSLLLIVVAMMVLMREVKELMEEPQ
jgi:hypothetical protein